MTDYKPFLHNIFENISLLKPKTNHYSAQGETLENIRTLVISDTVLQPEELEQIDKILLACKLDLNQKVDLPAAAFKKDPIALGSLDYCFLFGCSPAGLGFNFDLPPNRILHLSGLHWIKCLPVKALINSQEAKSDLWKNGLQIHFQGKG